MSSTGYTATATGRVLGAWGRIPEKEEWPKGERMALRNGPGSPSGRLHEPVTESEIRPVEENAEIEARPPHEDRERLKQEMHKAILEAKRWEPEESWEAAAVQMEEVIQAMTTIPSRARAYATDGGEVGIEIRNGEAVIVINAGVEAHPEFFVRIGKDDPGWEQELEIGQDEIGRRTLPERLAAALESQR